MKLQYDDPLSNSAFNFNLRCYNKEGDCPDLKYNFFEAGSADQCNARACSSKFFSCPDTGSHNARGSVVASYSGVLPPPPMFTAPQISASPHVGSNETVMPTYGVALLVVFFVGTFLALVGVFAYRRVQRERGFKWVMFDNHGGNTAGGVEMVNGRGAPGEEDKV